MRLIVLTVVHAAPPGAAGCGGGVVRRLRDDVAEGFFLVLELEVVDAAVEAIFCR